MERVVPDPSKSIRDGAIAPWNTPSYAHELEELLALADDYNLPVDVPFAQLTDEQRRLIVEGVPERNFGGLNGFFRWLERRKYKMHLRVFLSRWRTYLPCPACGGARLRPEALAVRSRRQELCRRLPDENSRRARRSSTSCSCPNGSSKSPSRCVDDVRSRLTYLVDVGVGYLALDRPLRTLSGGEAQRVALTATLGSSLVDMLYVLDEPSVGLHPADVGPLAAAIEQLQQRGNTVVVVEHEEEIIRRADQVVEFGPGAGDDGGRIVFQGTPQELEQSTDSRTGDWLAGRRRSAAEPRRTTDPRLDQASRRPRQQSAKRHGRVSARRVVPRDGRQRRRQEHARRQNALSGPGPAAAERRRPSGAAAAVANTTTCSAPASSKTSSTSTKARSAARRDRIR